MVHVVVDKFKTSGDYPDGTGAVEGRPHAEAEAVVYEAGIRGQQLMALMASDPIAETKSDKKKTSRLIPKMRRQNRKSSWPLKLPSDMNEAAHT